MKPLLASRRAGLIEAEVDGELVALHVDLGTCYGFNRTATRIWSLLEEPKTIAELCDALTSEFRIEREECERQLRELLEALARDGLIDLQPVPTQS